MMDGLQSKVAAVNKKKQAAISPLLAETVFLVEADNFSQYSLWLQYKDKFKTWEQLGGVMIEVGRINDRPICVALDFNKINDKMVCFYYPASVLVDWGMIEEWIDSVCFPLWDDETRHAKTDANNFHHCKDLLLRPS
ncbi:MAG: hypothetical protein WC511_01780 [Candidatus Pacearchaeota archaeon]